MNEEKRSLHEIIIILSLPFALRRSPMFLPSENETLPLIGTMTLVPQIVDTLSRIVEGGKHQGKKDEAYNIPVVAAGGIADGRGLVGGARP
jgi:hypothetical protein